MAARIASRSNWKDEAGKGTVTMPRTASATGCDAPSTDISVTMNSGRFSIWARRSANVPVIAARRSSLPRYSATAPPTARTGRPKRMKARK